MKRPQKPNRAQRRKSGQAPASQRAAARAVGTVTGRIHVRQPELHNLPATDKATRETFRQIAKAQFGIPYGTGLIDTQHMPIEPLDAGLRRILSRG